MTWQEIAEQIDSCEYLYLRSIQEETELRLKLVVEEARSQGRRVALPSDNPELKSLYEGNLIGSDDRCRLFELIYDYPISYTVVNETYGKYPAAPEAFAGRYFRVFSWSYLLEMTRMTTYASDDYPGPEPLQHHEIVCLNHVVDVITAKEPAMRMLRAGKPSLVQ